MEDLFCPFCGIEIQEEFLFCPFCGEALTETDKKKARRKNKRMKFFNTLKNFFISLGKFMLIFLMFTIIIVTIMSEF